MYYSNQLSFQARLEGIRQNVEYVYELLDETPFLRMYIHLLPFEIWILQKSCGGS